MKELSVTERLLHVWEEHSEGTKAERCQQISERIWGLLTLAALPETKPLFDQLYQILDFDKLFRWAGYFGATGIWGDLEFTELFQ